MLLKPKDYIEYLISTQINYTCTNLAHHKQTLSHDAVSDFLYQSTLNSADLWQLVSPHLEVSDNAMIIVDDSVQEKRYSRFIELVKRQYSGNTKSVVNGIGLVNMVYSTGNDGDFYPIDYRIYHPETDKQTKNEHFQEMFMDLVRHKDLSVNQIAFDSWYASCANLKLVHRQGWVFFTTLKRNRLVSRSKTSGYQSICEVEFSEQELRTGIKVKLNKVPFLVKVFKIVSPDGNIDYVITNDLREEMNVFQAELKDEIRGQVEDFHRSYKQLTGSEKCQCRKANSQRNHFACCYQAWVTLKVYAKKMKKSIYQAKYQLLQEYLIAQINNPTIQYMG